MTGPAMRGSFCVLRRRHGGTGSRDHRPPRIALSKTSCYDHWLWMLASRRSEEHTSELQSHVKLVCRLLLEKKKHMFDRLYRSMGWGCQIVDLQETELY